MKKRHIKYQPFSARRYGKKSKNKFLITLLISGFLLYALFTWILPTLIGSLSFVNRLKPIPQKEIPISENTSLAPPVLNIPFEATNTASIKVKGYSIPGTQVEIYLDDQLQTTIKASENGNFLSDSINLELGTNNISGKTIDDKNNRSLSSKPIRIFYSNEKPKLEIKDPPDNQIIKGGDKKMTITGSTDSDHDITITINNTRTIVDSNGNFSQVVDIQEGDNNIVVLAIDSATNSTQLTRKVTYEPQ